MYVTTGRYHAENALSGLRLFPGFENSTNESNPINPANPQFRRVVEYFSRIKSKGKADKRTTCVRPGFFFISKYRDVAILKMRVIKVTKFAANTDAAKLPPKIKKKGVIGEKI